MLKIKSTLNAEKFYIDEFTHIYSLTCSALKGNLFLNLTVHGCLDLVWLVSLCMVLFLITITSFVR